MQTNIKRTISLVWSSVKPEYDKKHLSELYFHIKQAELSTMLEFGMIKRNKWNYNIIELAHVVTG